MDGYPAGAENDPNAPWNDSRDKVCETCEGSGKLGGNFGYDCDDCNGHGYTEN